MDVGALTPPLWGFEEREKLMVFYERISGSRMHAAYFRAGGVHQDMPPGLGEDILKFCDHFVTVLDDIEGLLTENRIFKQRNVDIGIVNRAEAEMWGMSGVMLRSTGVKWDLRRSQPYECYNELDFKIPIGKNGDNYDRYVMRMEEMRESTKIMRQCIEKMPVGPVVSTDNKVVPPRRGEMKTSMEALIHHFKLYTEGFHVPAGETYAAVEAPKGGVRRLSGCRRFQQAVPLQDSRAQLRAPAGDGLHVQGPYAGRCFGGAGQVSISCLEKWTGEQQRHDRPAAA